MPTMEIHQRTIRRGVNVHNAGKKVVLRDEKIPANQASYPQYEPHCGIDGKTYANKCQVRRRSNSFWLTPFWWFCGVMYFPWKAHADGIGVQCRGECPCSTDGELFHFFFKRSFILLSFNWNIIEHLLHRWWAFPFLFQAKFCPFVF